MKPRSRTHHVAPRALVKVLSQFRGKRVLILGDVGVDRYTMGVVERISPEAPVPIVLVQQEKLKLGLAANVADNVRVLGGIPLLVGVVGGDRAADDFRAVLRESRISPSHLVQDETRRTVLKERVVSDRQQLLRVDYETSGSVSKQVSAELLDQFEALIGSKSFKIDAVILEDYAKGTLGQALIQKVITLSKKKGILVSVDPHIRTPWQHYLGASVLTPNKKEAEGLSGMAITDPKSLRLAGETILERTQAGAVVITLGKDGMALFEKGVKSSPCLIPTYAREVYDVSGAGDTVISVLSLARSCGASLRDAAVLGNVAAGIEVGKRGTATVSPEEIIGALSQLSSGL